MWKAHVGLVGRRLLEMGSEYENIRSKKIEKK